MSTLREKNEKTLKKILLESAEIKSFREGFKKSHGLDPLVETDKFPVTEEGFSWKKLQAKLNEADASSSFSQFLRAGIQQITNGMYESTPVTYTDWVKVVSSNKDTELYAPNQGVAFPRQVGPSTLYPEVGAAALDIQLKNYKFGAIYALEKELLDDDQTGTFQQQAGMLGEYMKIVQEAWVYGKLASVSGMQYIDLKIPVSETQPTTESVYPWSQAMVGGGKNRPATFTLATKAGIQDGIIGLMNQKNLQGIKMLVKPNRLISGPNQQFDIAILLNSAYYPSGAAAAGATGGAFSINPIKGIADYTCSRFVFKNDGTVNGDSFAWYLVDDTKPWFILQARELVTVEMEQPLSGASFNLDHYRYKGRSRFNADFIDPRFAWQGNDGSVVS